MSASTSRASFAPAGSSANMAATKAFGAGCTCSDSVVTSPPRAGATRRPSARSAMSAANTADSPPDRPLTERAVYTVVEVAKLLSLSRGSAYALVRDGTIPALRLGGRWVVPRARFHAWLGSLTDGDD